MASMASCPLHLTTSGRHPTALPRVFKNMVDNENKNASGRKEYVVGFLIDPTLSKVVLIRKVNPEWQRGLLNGVGGKVEPGEDATTAMHREFEEEAGVAGLEWKHYLTLLTPH